MVSTARSRSQQVRVLTPGAFEIHQKDKKGDFVLVDEGRTSLSEIPFAVAYSNRVGVLESRPPLADIAELNLKAYQTQSDLDNSCTSVSGANAGNLRIPPVGRGDQRRARRSDGVA